VSKYSVELVGLPNKLAEMRRVEVDLDSGATLAELVAALRQARPELEGSIIRPEQDKLAGHYTFNVNGRFHVDEYDVTVQPNDRILVVILAMGG
jgi:ThiS family